MIRFSSSRWPGVKVAHPLVEMTGKASTVEMNALEAIEAHRMATDRRNLGFLSTIKRRGRAAGQRAPVRGLARL